MYVYVLCQGPRGGTYTLPRPEGVRYLLTYIVRTTPSNAGVSGEGTQDAGDIKSLGLGGSMESKKACSQSGGSFSGTTEAQAEAAPEEEALAVEAPAEALADAAACAEAPLPLAVATAVALATAPPLLYLVGRWANHWGGGQRRVPVLWRADSAAWS